eukprot:3548536-Prymnesium_polylepis.1
MGSTQAISASAPFAVAARAPSVEVRSPASGSGSAHGAIHAATTRRQPRRSSDRATSGHSKHRREERCP